MTRPPPWWSTAGSWRQASARQTGIIGETFAFLRETRKWFLAPIIVLLLVIGLIVVLGGTAAAPFIYTLF